MFSSPLRGISISTIQDRFPDMDVQKVFVPSSGYLYFYHGVKRVAVIHDGFSSPLRGISISTVTKILHIGRINVFSSPLRGISISTLPRIPLENSKGIIWFAVQTHKPDNFMFISTCPELKMLYFTGIGAKS